MTPTTLIPHSSADHADVDLLAPLYRRVVGIDRSEAQLGALASGSELGDTTMSL